MFTLAAFTPSLPHEPQQRRHPGSKKLTLLGVQGSQVCPTHTAVLKFVSHVLAIQRAQLGPLEHGTHVPEHDAADGLVHAAKHDPQQAVLHLARATKSDGALTSRHYLPTRVTETHRPITTPFGVLMLILHGALGELDHRGGRVLRAQVGEHVPKPMPRRELPLGPLPPIASDQFPLRLTQLVHRTTSLTEWSVENKNNLALGETR